jgi:cysteine sulfinate desulfinase/cysteine desulfurase-like protein
VLTAMGLSPKRIDSALRLSLSVHTTEEEIDYAIETICRVNASLGLIMRRK